MAKLIDAGVEATESIVRAAHRKTQERGSWYVLNDPAFEPRIAVEEFQSQKVADDINRDRKKEEFLHSGLSRKSRTLHKKWLALANDPELYDQEEIDAARKAYEASLTKEQLRLKKEWKEMREKRKTNRKTKNWLRARDEEGTQEAELRNFRSVLDAPANAEHGPMLSAMEYMMYRLSGLLHDEYPDDGLVPPPIAGIVPSRDRSQWRVIPSGYAHDNPFDMQHLTEIMQTKLADELADPAVWTTRSTRVKGMVMKAYYIEMQEGDDKNMHANIAAAMCNIPDMKGNISPVYKIDGISVNKTAYQAECKRREWEALGAETAVPDYSGLTQGTLFIGPEAAAMMNDWMGVDVRRIEPSKRQAAV